MAISINMNTFPAVGGAFTLRLTKEDNRPWVVTQNIPWLTVVSAEAVSYYLYEMEVDVAANAMSADRIGTLVAGSDLETDSLSLMQLGTTTTLSADIVSQSPAGVIAAAGGQLTVDVHANGGTDSLTAASSSQAWCTLVSTTHGVTSGGVTATRFVFALAQNTGGASRSVSLTFTVGNGSATATATLSKTQAGAAAQTGSLAVAGASVAAAATGADAVISMTDVQASTLAVVTSAFTFITGASIQVSGGAYVLALTFPANTGAARSETVQISGKDSWGNTLTASMTLTQAAAGAARSLSVAWRENLGYDGVLDYAGGREDALITYTGSFTGSPAVSHGPLPAGVTVTLPASSVLRVEYAGGNIGETVRIPLTVSCTGSDSVVYTADIVVTLVASGVFPVWEDVFGVIASDEDWEDYELQEGDVPFYTGRAFAYPDEENIRVNVSRVVAPYLTGYYKEVRFVSGGVELGAYTFVRDYSYDRGMDYTRALVLNAPVNGRVPGGVRLSAAMWSPAAGGSMQVADGSGSLAVNQPLEKGLNLGEWISGGVGTRYTMGSLEYEVVSACRGALLKYLNAYGAYDFLLVEGVAKKSDRISRASYEKDAAALSAEFEAKDYQATMEAEWSGVTGWLTDEQSQRMRHLVESVEVYMIDTATGLEVPVRMTDSQLQYKTFDNNGRKMVNYTLKWAESQKKIRR